MLGRVTDDDRVFKALADPTRRFLLDRLYERDGRTLTELEAELEMTRFGVMKHLRVLEEANLIVTRRSGREKLHFLNPVPIRLIHDRWIDKYRERQVWTSRRGGSACTTSPSAASSGIIPACTISGGDTARKAPPGRRSNSIVPG